MKTHFTKVLLPLRTFLPGLLCIHLHPSMSPSTLISFHVSTDEKHPHSMMLPTLFQDGDGVFRMTSGVFLVIHNVLHRLPHDAVSPT